MYRHELVLGFCVESLVNRHKMGVTYIYLILQ